MPSSLSAHAPRLLLVVSVVGALVRCEGPPLRDVIIASGRDDDTLGRHQSLNTQQLGSAGGRSEDENNNNNSNDLRWSEMTSEDIPEVDKRRIMFGRRSSSLSEELEPRKIMNSWQLLPVDDVAKSKSRRRFKFGKKSSPESLEATAEKRKLVMFGKRFESDVEELGRLTGENLSTEEKRRIMFG